MEVDDHHLVRITFRELWAKGASDKRIWLRAVQNAQDEEVEDGEHFSGQI